MGRRIQALLTATHEDRTNMENELKPCPLCGANDVKAIAEQVDAVSWHGEVECVDCEMRVSIDVCEPTPERAIDDAIEIWNRRAALPFDAALAPEGWKLAPVEPTMSMVVDGFESDFRFRESPEFAAMAGCKGAAEAAKVCYRAMLAAAPVAPAAAAPFQQRVQPWLMECFGPMIAGDREERNHRFLEEALELVQACGCTAHEAHQLVDYTFGRPVGEPAQEVGGVMVTLAALCLANGLDLHAAGETELARISVPETVAKIRAKQAAKPKHSPLPASPAPLAAAGLMDEQREALTWAAERASRDCLLDYRKALNAVLAAAPKAAEQAPVADAARAEPVGYLPAYELDRLKSGHNANLRSAKFGRSALDGDVAVFLAPAPAQQAVTLTDGARDVLAERRRQVEQEGWTPEHDDSHNNGELARAASCYAHAAGSWMDQRRMPAAWPWESHWWKPTTSRCNLVKAGALILADIERLDRAALQSHSGGD
jgi:Lar family restriction alleviation protein